MTTIGWNNIQMWNMASFNRYISVLRNFIIYLHTFWKDMLLKLPSCLSICFFGPRSGIMNRNSMKMGSRDGFDRWGVRDGYDRYVNIHIYTLFSHSDLVYILGCF